MKSYEFTDDEVLVLVRALGVYRNRMAQRGRWLLRKRMVTLRHRLADCMTIGDEDETDGVRKAISRTKADMESRKTICERVDCIVKLLEGK